ncbi:MAG: tetratricopeptide repeat protein [Calditrichaeota bacterium]|nr:tetratricopeptide repeat protein [Calditrichota bacterium]
MSEDKPVVKKIADVVSDLKTIFGFVFMLVAYFGYKFSCQPEQLKAVSTYEIVFDVSSAMAGDLRGESKLVSVKKALRDNLFYSVIGENDNVALRFFGGACPSEDENDVNKLDGLAEDFGPKEKKVQEKIVALKEDQLRGRATLTGAVIDAISHLHAAVADFSPEKLAEFNRRIIVVTASDDACSSISFDEAIEQKLAEAGGTIKRKDIEDFMKRMTELRVVGVGLDAEQKKSLIETLRSIDNVPVFADNAFELTQLLGSQDAVSEFQRNLEIFAQAQQLDKAGKFVEAQSKYEQAAAGGIPQAHRIIGEVYYAHQDYDKALQYFKEAADKDDARAKTHVAKMMLKGQGGAEKDRHKAIALLQEAFRAGDASAAEKLKQEGIQPVGN